MKIFRIPCHNLGDSWGSVCRLIEIAHYTREAVGIYPRYINENGVQDNSKHLLEIMEQLPVSGLVTITSSEPNQEPISWPEAIASRRFETPLVYRPSDSKTVCVQFDGKTIRRHSDGDIGNFVDRLLAAGYQCEDLGGMRPLAECVSLLSRCHAFVGADSGMAQVSYSVGPPTHIVRADGNFEHHHLRQARGHTTLQDVDLNRLEETGVLRAP